MDEVGKPISPWLLAVTRWPRMLRADSRIDYRVRIPIGGAGQNSELVFDTQVDLPSVGGCHTYCAVPHGYPPLTYEFGDKRTT